MTTIARVISKNAAVLAVGLMFAAAGASAGELPNKPVSGTLTVEQVQIAFIGSGNIGGGHRRLRDRDGRPGRRGGLRDEGSFRQHG